MSKKASKPVNFFISYAREDERFKDSLIKYLTLWERNKIIKIWSDGKIEAGQKWDDEIKKALDTSEVVLYLISQDFLVSDYINSVEIKKTLSSAKTNKKVVVPILLSNCTIRSQIIPNDPTTEITKFQWLPRNSNPISNWPDQNEAWVHVCNELERLIIKLQNKN